eukprot:TRINITY_DN75876_c0_g1_i1.p1 TRINITY_DN75876_c0_g1~~TRINITY_DN75876_c0_g1_i1.p1  ORF type:complete len:296 (-),score=68.78 TRINITY_DN75876_c0_g1_i1:107-994(-)
MMLVLVNSMMFAGLLRSANSQAGLGGANAGSSMGGVQQQGSATPKEVDWACVHGPRGEVWQSAKKGFQGLFAGPSGPYQVVSKETMKAAMDGIIADLKNAGAFSPQAADECGLGKLSVQLASLVGLEDPAALMNLFAGHEPIASPVLTMLLDVPWVALAVSGWPVFGLLNQINLRKQLIPGVMQSIEALDGTTDANTKSFLAEVTTSLGSGDKAALAKAGAAFLKQESKGSALGPLTALAAQAIGSPSLDERGALLQTVQAGFKQVLGTAAELDMALTTQWPVFGIIHATLETLV